jgi:hypothetical protein
VNQVCRIPQETFLRINEIARNLRHPGTIRIDPHSSNVHRVRAQLDHKQHNDANGSEYTEGFDREEVVRS